jgi:hypothetical protein
MVLAAFADTYLAHAAASQDRAGDQDQHVFGLNPERELERQKTVVGNFIKLLKDLNDLEEKRALDGNNGLLDLLIAEKLTEITLQRESIWPIERYSAISLNCESDYFLEALLSNIKGCVISFQSWVKKTENKEKSQIIFRLNTF